MLIDSVGRWQTHVLVGKGKRCEGRCCGFDCCIRDTNLKWGCPRFIDHLHYLLHWTMSYTNRDSME